MVGGGDQGSNQAAFIEGFPKTQLGIPCELGRRGIELDNRSYSIPRRDEAVQHMRGLTSSTEEC